MQVNPENLYYSQSHEWVSVEGGVATIGITDHAQAQLGELVYVDLPEVGDMLDAGNEAAVVESVKTAADVYTPVSGEVLEINTTLIDSPEIVNEQPYAEGWLFKIKLDKPKELEDLLSAAEYTEQYSD